MSVDPKPAPEPAKPDWVKTTKRVLAWAGWVVAAATVIVGVVTAVQNHQPVPVPVIPPFPEVGATARGDDGAVYVCGWVDDEQARAESLQRFPAVAFSQTPAGKVVMGTDKDTYLWRPVRKAAGHKETDDWYCNVDQKSVGCCVGCGWKHSVDLLSGIQIALLGKQEEFRPVSVESIYGMSRVDYGSGSLRGDGSAGVWAREAVEKGGVAEMKKYDGVDLTTFSPERARQFGSQGVPAVVKAAAKPHPVKGCALVTTYAEVSKAIQQGYPVAVCSNVGYNAASGNVGSRDKDGFIAPRGTWNHCMCFAGVRFGDRPGVFVLNSWGDTAHAGPRWPADAPPAGFWITPADCERMARQGDTFALADLDGFPARPLQWDVQAPFPLQRNYASVRRSPLDEFFLLAP